MLFQLHTCERLEDVGEKGGVGDLHNRFWIFSFNFLQNLTCFGVRFHAFRSACATMACSMPLSRPFPGTHYEYNWKICYIWHCPILNRIEIERHYVSSIRSVWSWKELVANKVQFFSGSPVCTIDRSSNFFVSAPPILMRSSTPHNNLYQSAKVHPPRYFHANIKLCWSHLNLKQLHGISN